jgi:GntR family transcriptional repressor for pyruvate dehydrogenase complex
MNDDAIDRLLSASHLDQPPRKSRWALKQSEALDLLASDVPQPRALLELIEVRRLFEPAATALAAERITDGDLLEIAAQFEAMLAARDDLAKFKACDIAFHRLVAAVTGNKALVHLLGEMSTRTVDARMWHGLFESDAADAAIAEHAAIQAALIARDPALAHAAALTHVNTTEKWLHRYLASDAELTSD